MTCHNIINFCLQNIEHYCLLMALCLLWLTWIDSIHYLNNILKFYEFLCLSQDHVLFISFFCCCCWHVECLDYRDLVHYCCNISIVYAIGILFVCKSLRRSAISVFLSNKFPCAFKSFFSFSLGYPSSETLHIHSQCVCTIRKGTFSNFQIFIIVIL